MQGTIQIQYQYDPSTGELTGTTTINGPGGKPLTFQASANVIAIRTALMARMRAQPPAAASGNIFGDAFKAVTKAAKSVAKGKIFKDIGGAVKKAMNSPITQMVFPPALATKMAVASPQARQALSTALTPLLGPAAPMLGPKVLEAANNVLYKATRKNDPKAKKYIVDTAKAAAGGDQNAAQIMKLFNVLDQPVTPNPAAGLPGGNPIANAPRPPIALPPALNIKALAASVIARLRAREPSARDYVQKTLAQAAAGDKQAMQIRDALTAAAKQKPPAIPAALQSLMQQPVPPVAAPAMTEGGPAVAGGGCFATPAAAAGGSVAYGSNAWNPTPMNVQNYFQISGVDLGPFYGDNVVDVVPEAFVVSGRRRGAEVSGDQIDFLSDDMSVAGNGEFLMDTMTVGNANGMDIIIGANGAVMGKAWDGLKWVWQEIKPRVGIRDKSEAFTLRDAMRMGIASSAARQRSL